MLVQPWFFGKARLVVSGGLSSGFLSKQEFQRSTSIGSGSSDTVIGLKTNTRFQIPRYFMGTRFCTQTGTIPTLGTQPWA